MDEWNEEVWRDAMRLNPGKEDHHSSYTSGDVFCGWGGNVTPPVPQSRLSHSHFCCFIYIFRSEIFAIHAILDFRSPKLKYFSTSIHKEPIERSFKDHRTLDEWYTVSN
ncbi:hypothetical protein BpHYR1_043350 [Brachionus plicatilis]|uniref:Uncharacterized protein n=1 Tax=Brachionus plicatilis TaxID=10195 RepID=A0A3M7RN93_BRAPC|nr:hypothetical protein BpHYR1_043350 [Brachionus plicatilis]